MCKSWRGRPAAITQTWRQLWSDAEKYGRELREDCGVKRVASTREPALAKAAERRRGKIDGRPLKAKSCVFIFSLRSCSTIKGFLRSRQVGTTALRRRAAASWLVHQEKEPLVQRNRHSSKRQEIHKIPNTVPGRKLIIPSPSLESGAIVCSILSPDGILVHPFSKAGRPMRARFRAQRNGGLMSIRGWAG